MALPQPRPFQEAWLVESTTSIATTPLAAIMIAPKAGYIERVMACAGAGTQTGTCTISVIVNGGSDITGGALTIAAGSGARAGTVVEFGTTGTSSVYVNEGDCITFTPSGATGTVAGGFGLVIR